MIDVDEFRRRWVRRESSRLMTEGEPLEDIPAKAYYNWSHSEEYKVVEELLETRARAKEMTVKWATLILQDLIDNPTLRLDLEMFEPVLMNRLYSALGLVE